MKMSWENRWKAFKDPLIQEYGEKVGTFFSTFNPNEEGFYRVKHLYEQLSNYFGGNVPGEVQDSFIQDFNKDYILENLQSHGWKQFYKKLCSTFKIDFELWGMTPVKDRDFFSIKFPKPVTSEGKQECERLAEFFGYLPTFRGSIVEFEPKFTEKVDITEDSFGYVYHIMPLRTKEDRVAVESVEKNGLRVRNGKLDMYRDPVTGKRELHQYRNLVPRVYVYILSRELAKTEEKQKIQFRYLLNMKGLTWDECAIFAINVQHFPGTFYRDSVARDAAYTYQNIPAERLTRIH